MYRPESADEKKIAIEPRNPHLPAAAPAGLLSREITGEVRARSHACSNDAGALLVGHGYWKSWNMVFPRRDACAGQRRVRPAGREERLQGALDSRGGRPRAVCPRRVSAQPYRAAVDRDRYREHLGARRTNE